MEETNKMAEQTEEVATTSETAQTEAVIETAETAIAEEITEEAVEIVEAEAEAPAKKKGMNLPNKLSLLRIALVPVMVALFLWQTPRTLLFALVVFIIASITDFLDGHIARKYNLVTDFGKFIDPIADKLLVITALVLITCSGMVIVPKFTNLGAYIGIISLIIVIAREFAISGLRLVAANNGTVIAADKLGKLKTVTQILAIVILLFSCFAHSVLLIEYNIAVMTQNVTLLNAWNYIYLYSGYIGTGVYIISTVICIISGISYLVKNRQAFMLSK